MRFKINPDSVNYNDLSVELQEQFPEYSFAMRGKQFLVAKKSSTVGANIVIRKNTLMVAGNFPTVGGTVVFMLCLFLLGFLIPLIIYLVAFHSKMKTLEKEIGAYLQEKYEVKNV